MTIHGDVIDIIPKGYVWELYQNGFWIEAPGVNSTPEYAAAPLLLLDLTKNKLKLRRRILTSGSCVYDSYYTVKLKLI